MRQFRFRKLTDGSVRLTDIRSNPSGLSTATPTEVLILLMSPEEAAAVEYVDDSVPAAPVPVPPAEPKAAPVVVPDPLDQDTTQSVTLATEVPADPVPAPVAEPIPDVPPAQEG